MAASTRNQNPASPDLGAWDIHYYDDAATQHAPDWGCSSPLEPPPRLGACLLPDDADDTDEDDGPHRRICDFWIDRARSLCERGFSGETYAREREQAVAWDAEQRELYEREREEACRNAVARTVGAGCGERAKGEKRSGKTIRRAPVGRQR
jgi:hypothetical protein